MVVALVALATGLSLARAPGARAASSDSVGFKRLEVTVLEAAGTVTLDVERFSPTPGSTVTVDYTTADGAAAAGTDYTTTTGQLVFQDSSNSRSVTVPIVADSSDEPLKAFFVDLSVAAASPGSVDPARARAKVNILDDDAGGAWGPTGSLTTGRARPTLTVLNDGRVLAVGGGGAASAVPEVYDPNATLPAQKVFTDTNTTEAVTGALEAAGRKSPLGVWAPTPPLALPRSGHTATLLRNGKVLVAGGRAVSAAGAPVITESVALYDPVRNLWEHPTNTMNIRRYAHTATLLNDGKVLVAGGITNAPDKSLKLEPFTPFATPTAELYDPVGGTWELLRGGPDNSPISLHKVRYGHASSLLADGRVLLLAGITPQSQGAVSTNDPPTSVVEVYDPVARRFSAGEVSNPTAASQVGGHHPTTTPLKGPACAGTEPPPDWCWSLLVTSTAMGGTAGKAGLLDQEGEEQTVTLAGQPTRGSFTLALQDRTSPPIRHDATAKDVEAALEAIEGIGTNGVAVRGGPLPLIPVVVEFVGPLLVLSDQPDLRGDGRGLSGDGPASVSVTETRRHGLVWKPTGPALTGSDFSLTAGTSVTAIGDGRVFVAGGANNFIGESQDSVQGKKNVSWIYDPATPPGTETGRGTWQRTASSLTTARAAHAAALVLADGVPKVLVAGGLPLNGPTAQPEATAEVFTLAVVKPRADLKLSATAPEVVSGGEEITFTLTVGNLGDHQADGVVLTDTLPAQVVYRSSAITRPSSPDQQEACSLALPSDQELARGEAARKVICGVGPLAVGETATVKIIGLVSPGEPRAGVPSTSFILQNLAVVTAATDDNDVKGGANTATTRTSVRGPTAPSTNVEGTADLGVILSSEPEPIYVGQDLTYTSTVTNIGPEAAERIEIIHLLPYGAEFRRFGPLPTGMECRPPAVGTVACTLPSLAKDAKVELSVVASPTVGSSATGSQFHAQSNVTVAAATPDGTPSNNSATVSDQVRSDRLAPAVPGTPDLAVAMVDDPDPVTTGGKVIHTVVVRNNGPGPAHEVMLHLGVFGAAATSALPPSGVRCAETGLQRLAPSGGTDRSIQCLLGLMAENESVALTFVTTHSGFAALVTATADVYLIGTSTDASYGPPVFPVNFGPFTGEILDPHTPNNRTTTTTAVVPASETPRADVRISLSDAPDPVAVGGTLTYTVAVVNSGPGTAEGVVFEDRLPASVTYKSSEPPSGGSCGLVGVEVHCHVGRLPPGTTAVTRIVVTPNRAESVTNYVQVRSNHDLNPDNDVAMATTRVTTTPGSADVAAALTDAPDPAAVGKELTYTVTATNAGPETADVVVVSDTLPEGLTYRSATASQGSCGHSGKEVTCHLGAISRNGSAVATIVVVPTAAGTVANTVTASAGTGDPNGGNNSATTTTTVTEAAKDPGPGGGGSGTTHTLEVTRAGSGSGRVTSDPTGIDCGTDCTETFAKATTVSLTATAASGSTFAGWSGACSGTGACRLTTDADRAVTASFDAARRTAPAKEEPPPTRSGDQSAGQPARQPSGQHDRAPAGYWLVASDGGVFAFGDAGFFGSTGAIKLNQPIVSTAPTPSGNGYWLVASDGGVFAFGDAGFFGSTGAIKLNQPIVAMAPTASGNGYWLVASDGGVFAFGDAGFFGSTGAIKLNQPITAMAPNRSGNGYWMAASDGGIFAFGDAAFRGSAAGSKPAQRIVAMAVTPSGNGYWMAAADGSVLAFGDAVARGSVVKPNQPIVSMARTQSGNGYVLVATDGGVFAFGDAGFFGSTGAIKLNQPIVAVGNR